MKCPNCQKEIVSDSYFCTWCDRFLPAPERGEKAGLFARFVAASIDPLIALFLYFLSIALFGGISPDMASKVAVFFPLVYLIWFLALFRKGKTPGKLLLGLQVIGHRHGEIPGFWRMLVREIVGKFLSGLFLGIGYFWAIFDNNSQAWHDKLVGTVVLKVRGLEVMAREHRSKSAELPDAEMMRDQAAVRPNEAVHSVRPHFPGSSVKPMKYAAVAQASQRALAGDSISPRAQKLFAVTLLGISGPLQGRRFEVEKEFFRMGAGQGNDLCIPDDYVSGNHAYLRYTDGRLWLGDQHSRNGTFLNKNRLEKYPVIVSFGDRILMGESTFEVVRPS